MTDRIPRLVAAAILGAALALPAATLAADPTPSGPPPAVVDWRFHLAHMRSMGGTFGDHVAACVEVHGSMNGMFGPNGSMAGMMAGMMDGGMMR